MRKAFYFTSKAIFLLKMFKFKQNGLIRKVRLISNFKFQTIVIRILSNISRIKGNQTVKFGQSKECNMRNNFLEKS